MLHLQNVEPEAGRKPRSKAEAEGPSRQHAVAPVLHSPFLFWGTGDQLQPEPGSGQTRVPHVAAALSAQEMGPAAGEPENRAHTCGMRSALYGTLCIFNMPQKTNKKKIICSKKPLKQ